MTLASHDDAFFGELRAREFARLDARGETYLDYTGSGLYAASQVESHAEMLRGAVLGNPHSDSPASRASTALVERARAAVLRALDCDAETHDVCFTANASGALRLVAEAFPFRPGSRLVLSADNHNSVNGFREFANRRGADMRYIRLDDELRLAGVADALARAAADVPHLFAFPAQSNFSGVRHPLRIVRQAREMGYAVMLDAAAYVPTSRLSLREVPADFVSLSFYKMFGYPTGVGALVARRDALTRLERPWFAGGTVDFVSTLEPMHLRKHGAEGLEDGTPNFLAAAAVCDGLDLLERVGMDRLGRRVETLTGEMLRGLLSLRHRNGAPAVTIHGPREMRERGGTVAFNLLTPGGEIVDFRRVEARARDARISIRGGCFCNPGAAEHAFGFTAEGARRCFGRALADGFDLDRLRECLGGCAVGALRASVGIATTSADVRRLLSLLAEIIDGASLPDVARARQSSAEDALTATA